MINEKQTLYLTIIAIILGTIGIGMSYYKAEGPTGPIGPVGPAGPAGPQGEKGLPGARVPGPGINLKVTDVEIGSEGLTKVTMTVTDASGQPMTNTDFSMSFLLAVIEEDASGTPIYKNYFSRSATGAAYTLDGVITQPLLGSINQPGTENSGTWEELSPGVLVYTFGKAVPSDYDASATHVFAAYAYRPSRDEIANVVYAFVPNKGTPDVWEVSDTETCNRCHDPLALHGGPRQEFILCNVCHTPDGLDPETGESIDMKVMIHKIHMGEELPSVQAGAKYYIVGHSQSVADYSEIVFPANVLNCDVCHSGPDRDSYKENPSIAACGSCHDTVDFANGVGHIKQTNDNGCSSCHPAVMTKEFDLSIPGAHIATERRSSQLPGFNIDIISISNTGPGQKPEVTYSIKNDEGEVIPLVDIDRVRFYVAGPTDDYATSWQEDALATSIDNGDGTYKYTITTAIPSDAEGSWAIGAEGRALVDIDDGAGGTINDVRDTTTNEVYYIPVTDSVAVPRRTIVSEENCLACHEDISAHGDNRRSVEYCVVCHIPDLSEGGITFDFKVMIHRLHEESDYPADLLNCEKCHVEDSYALPLDSEVLGTTIKDGDVVISYTPPVQSACLGCHPSDESAAHATTMTSFGVEACVVCHGAGKEFAVGETGTVWAEIQLVNIR